MTQNGNSAYGAIEVAITARGAATITLARADKHNALNEQMIDELHQAAKQLGADPAVRVVILAARGKSFCAGGDLGWMRAQMDKGREERIRQASKLAQMLEALDELPKPLIGRVHGPAFGGGVGLMAICDFVVAANEAHFVLSETRLGLIPATIAPYVVRRMGEGNARQVFMNSLRFDVQAAMRFGLVSQIAGADELNQAVMVQVNAYLDCAPGAVTEAKALCRHVARAPAAGQLEETVQRLADRWESDEAQAGVNAFFARQKPPWIIAAED